MVGLDKTLFDLLKGVLRNLAGSSAVESATLTRGCPQFESCSAYQIERNSCLHSRGTGVLLLIKESSITGS